MYFVDGTHVFLYSMVTECRFARQDRFSKQVVACHLKSPDFSSKCHQCTAGQCDTINLGCCVFCDQCRRNTFEELSQVATHQSQPLEDLAVGWRIQVRRRNANACMWMWMWMWMWMRVQLRVRVRVRMRIRMRLPMRMPIPMRMPVRIRIQYQWPSEFRCMPRGGTSAGATLQCRPDPSPHDMATATPRRPELFFFGGKRSIICTLMCLYLKGHLYKLCG